MLYVLPELPEDLYQLNYVVTAAIGLSLGAAVLAGLCSCEAIKKNV